MTRAQAARYPGTTAQRQLITAPTAGSKTPARKRSNRFLLDSLSFCPWCLSIQTDSTGTIVLDSRYDEIMAKPTASDNGKNRERTGSAMMNAGMKTDKMH